MGPGARRSYFFSWCSAPKSWGAATGAVGLLQPSFFFIGVAVTANPDTTHPFPVRIQVTPPHRYLQKAVRTPPQQNFQVPMLTAVGTGFLILLDDIETGVIAMISR